jgi:chromosome segregation ATPase
MGNKSSRVAKPVISPQDILAERVRNEEIQKKQLQDQFDQLRIKHSNLTMHYLALQEEVGDGNNLEESLKKKMEILENNLVSNYGLIDTQGDLINEKNDLIRQKEDEINKLEKKLTELIIDINTQDRVFSFESNDLDIIGNNIGYYKKITYLLSSLIIAYSVYRIVVKLRN